MLHQSKTNSLRFLVNILSSSSRGLSIFLLSLLLAACGSEKNQNEKLELVPDGQKPSFNETTVVNKCNFEKSVGPGDTVYFDLEASESIMAPTVTIAGNFVNVKGQHNDWEGEYHFPDNREEDVKSGLKDFIEAFSDDTSEAENISDDSNYSNISGSDTTGLSDAITARYEIEISKDEEISGFTFNDLFDRVFAQQMVSYNAWEALKDSNLTVDKIESKLKADIVAVSNTILVTDISYTSTFSEIAAGDPDGLAATLISNYQIQISDAEKANPNFTYDNVLDRVLMEKIPAYSDFKTIVGVTSNTTLSSYSLDISGKDETEEEIIKEKITNLNSAFQVKTKDDLLTAFDWLNKIQSLEIPFNITYQDTSGEQGDDFISASTDSLRYCEDEDCQCFPADISGTWRLRHKAGAFGVGRAEGSIGDWASSDYTITQRGCLFDDTYTFTAEVGANDIGDFSQEMGEETWLEPWQSPNGIEECGAPQSPFDGSTPGMQYVWNVSEKTLTLTGYGAHLVLPRVTNGLENTGAIPVDQDTVFKVATASESLLVLDILSAGNSPWWHFELEKIGSTNDDDSDDSGDSGRPSNSTGNRSSGLSPQHPAELFSSTPFDLTLPFGDPVEATVSGPDNDIFSSPDTSAESANAGFSLNYGQLSNPNAYNPLYVINDSKALRYIKDGDLISSSVSITLDNAIDEENGFEFKVEVYSGHNYKADENDPSTEKTREITFKFKNSAAEKTVLHDGLGWNTLTFDFTGEAISNETEITFVNTQSDVGDGSKDWTLFIDDIQQITQTTDSEGASVDVSTSIMDFEAVSNNSIVANDEAHAEVIDANTPLTFGEGGSITFYASVLSGATADVRFVLQRLANDTEGNGEGDTETSYTTDPVTVSGSEEGFYSFEIPKQYALTFSEILLLIDTPNEAVKINNIRAFVTDSAIGDTVGPFDMSSPFGEPTPAAVTGDDGNIFSSPDTSAEEAYAGFAYNFDYEGIGSTNPLINEPLTFGDGGFLSFTASVIVTVEQPLDTADVRFKFEKEASPTGDQAITEPSCNTAAIAITGSTPVDYKINIPVQGPNTFSNIIMYIDSPNIQVKIENIKVTVTDPNPAAVAVNCGLSNIGRLGPLDMTGAYGYGAVSGDQGELFKNDISLGGTFGGFSNKTIELYPFEFGEVSTLEFTASVPEGQSLTDVDIEFEFQKEKSDLDKICEKAPLWRTPTQTISGSVDQSYSVDIPSQGGNTFSNMILEILSNDVNVKITDVYVTTTAKTDDEPTVPAGCEGTPPPSVYPADGFNSAAYFGAFGSDGGNTPTIQDGDAYEFPGESANWAGWSNRNRTLYPIDFASTGFFAPKYIYFCASAEPADPNDENANPAETVSLYFKLENQPFPNNSAEIVTPDVSIARDSVMRAYRAEFATNQISNSFLMFMNERDIEVTFGKVKGTWNGQPEQNYTTDTDGDDTPDYCDDFPNSTPGWIDSDVDGASDDDDAFPNNENEWADSDEDGVGNNGDAFPDDPDETTDTDFDGIGDNADADPDDPNVQ
jgi:hypothetical protein